MSLQAKYHSKCSYLLSPQDPLVTTIKNYMTKRSDHPRLMNESFSVTHKFHVDNNTVCILYEATEIKATGNKL